MDLNSDSDTDINGNTRKESNEVIYLDSEDEGTQSQSKLLFSLDCLFEYPLEKNDHGDGVVRVSKKDVECLRPAEYLNDVIIDFWMKYVFHERLNKDARNQTLVFSSLFYNSTHKEGWTKHCKPFSKDFIFIPIPKNQHWVMATICFPGFVNSSTNNHNKRKKVDVPFSKSEGPNSSTTSRTFDSDEDEASHERAARRLKQLDLDFQPEEDKIKPGPLTRRQKRKLIAKRKEPLPMILLFDSLRSCGVNAESIFHDIRQFLTVEWRKGDRDKNIVFTEETIPGVIVEVPQQQNYYDCGIYLLQCFEEFFLHPIDDFSIPFQSLSNWFSEEETSYKRGEIFEAIWDLHVEVLKTSHPTRHSLLPSDFLTRSLDTSEESRHSPVLFDKASQELDDIIDGTAFLEDSTLSDDSAATVERNGIESSSLSPTPPMYTYSSPDSPYQADDSCSSDDSDVYVPLLTPKELQDRLKGNDNSESEEEEDEVPVQRFVRGQQPPNKISQSEYELRSPKEKRSLFYYSDLEDSP